MFKKWKQKLKEKLNKINEDDRGSAFLVVILGVMFLTIVGSTVLSLATNYVITVIVDQDSTETFYETEGAIAEIRSGLEEICGDSSEAAYMYIIDNYSDPLTMTDTMKKEYTRRYLYGIVNRLENRNWTDGGKPLSDVTNWKIAWDGADQDDPSTWTVISMDPVFTGMVRRPSTLDSTYGGGSLRYGFRVDPDTGEEYLTISGLRVQYTDDDGFKSTVQTDYNIRVPDYQFDGNSTFDELKKYILICDKKLTVNNTGNVGVIGNVYAGGETGRNGSSTNYKTGIEVGAQKGPITFDSDRIISRGDLAIKNAADVSITNESGELWLKNIILENTVESGLHTKLNLLTNSYILNDLSIDNDNTEVNIGGSYYGYSHSRRNGDPKATSAPGGSTEPDEMDSEYSSAILVNGVNTKLKSDNLKKLILAGRTFVAKSDQNYVKLAKSDIMMGESAAVKSNQIAYLLPDDCIVAGHNPLIYARDPNETEIYQDTDVDYMEAVNLEVLKQKPVYAYLKNQDETDPKYKGNPVVANFNNSGGYAFLYLNFKSPSHANQYFSEFYADPENKEVMDERAKTYITSTEIDGMKIDASLYLIAGNIIHNYDAVGGSVTQIANYYDGSGEPNSDMLLDGLKKMQNYLGKQLSLVNSGYKSGMATRYENLEGKYQKELVKDKVIDYSKITMDVTRDNTDTDLGGKVYVRRGDCKVSELMEQKGILICDSDVELDVAFEGLILTKGVINVTGSGYQAKANSALVGSLLEMIRNDSELSKYFRDLNDAENRSSNVADCISYENWKRDE